MSTSTDAIESSPEPMLSLAVHPNSKQLLKSSRDVKSEARSFMGLLRHDEEKMAEKAKAILKKDRRLFIQVLSTCVDEWTPMHACTLKGARKVVKVALKAGIDPNLEMGLPDGLPGRCTPLHLAAYRGDISILELLVQFGALVNKRDNSNHTPLYYALRQGNTLAAKKLLKHGADPSELSREERVYFKNKIDGKGTALLCVPVRGGSQKQRSSSPSSKDKISS